MRRIIAILCLCLMIAVPVDALEFTAPKVPASGREYMPDETENFGQGLMFILQSAVERIHPNVTEAISFCGLLISASLIFGMVSDLSDNTEKVTQLTGIAIVAVILLQPTKILIHLGVDTVQQISQYGKMLLPVLTSAMAAQGSVSKSGALYSATVFFDALLSSAISKLLVPLVYTFIFISIASRILNHSILQDMRRFLKWLLTWGLKIILYVFTGYISITGVVGGTTDAAMLKATKLTISGVVPVVGNILSDASEAVLVSASMMKNAVGIYGLLAVMAIWVGPFIQTGVQYLLLKITAGICGMFAGKQMSALMKDFSDAMGLVLAMTGTMCLIILISIICFMRSVP